MVRRRHQPRSPLRRACAERQRDAVQSTRGPPQWTGKIRPTVDGSKLGHVRQGGRKVRASLERVVGKRRAIALWRERAETMPAGAEEEEREQNRRRERVAARGRTRSGVKSRRATTARDSARR